MYVSNFPFMDINLYTTQLTFHSGDSTEHFQVAVKILEKERIVAVTSDGRAMGHRRWSAQKQLIFFFWCWTGLIVG